MTQAHHCGTRRPANSSRRRHGQRGMTLISFLLAVSIAALLGTLAFRLIPIYLNHMKVVASLESLKSQPQWASGTRDEILRTLQKHWDIDSVDDVMARDVTITKEENNRLVKVRVKYDVQRTFIRNIDLLVHFDDSVEAVPH